MFSAICNPNGGAAPLTGYHAHRTFDFDQAQHPAFNLVGAGGGGGAPPGCCLALTMEWLHNWRAHPLQAYPTWVNGGGGQLNVLNHTVGVFAGGGPWHATTNNLMAGLGFAAAFGGALTAGPVWLGGQAGLSALALSAQFTILIASGRGGAHAVGLKRAGNAVFFFDSNHGELFFQSAGDFASWFFAGNYSWACLRPVVGAVAPKLHSLRYN